MAQETEPSSKVMTKSQDLPKVAQPTGMDFIEFAVDESEHQRLTGFLQKTGFAHVATHKVKQVELWQQGGICLVINRESQSFAQRYHTEHGLSVCAYGLSCPDVPGLIERATKLGYQIEYADPEYDTHGIAAITGPTGALLYLVDSNDPSPH